jgi:uncharacterized protein with PIN domain
MKSNLHLALFKANSLSSEIEEKLIESGGEITPEVEELLRLKDFDQKALEEQTDLMAMGLERIAQVISYYNDQIEHLEKLVKGLERTHEKMGLYIEETLTKLNLEAVEGEYKRLSLRKTPPKVEILDELAIDQEFKEIKLTESIKKKAIADALKSGRELHWARLVSGKSLSISNAKPKKLKESENE